MAVVCSPSRSHISIGGQSHLELTPNERPLGLSGSESPHIALGSRFGFPARSVPDHGHLLPDGQTVWLPEQSSTPATEMRFPQQDTARERV